MNIVRKFLVAIALIFVLTAGIVCAAPLHNGWKEVRYLVSARAVGETTWTAEYHYSRAQLKAPIFGWVVADSGRVWGNDFTRAESPWDAVANIAYSYYGN